jgi:DNA-damage-inducible protein D
MSNETGNTDGGNLSPFERIKRANDAQMEFWSSREFAGVLSYGDYRNFEGVVEKTKMACFNSGHRIEDHFVDVTEMIEIGKGGQRQDQGLSRLKYIPYGEFLYLTSSASYPITSGMSTMTYTMR